MLARSTPYKEDEPSWEPACSSSNAGALKWYIDGEKCYEYWCDNGTDCSTCISVCPYNTGPKTASTYEFGEDKIRSFMTIDGLRPVQAILRRPAMGRYMLEGTSGGYES